jgi:hypothetical protein
MSARSGPRGGYHVSGIPTAISKPGFTVGASVERGERRAKIQNMYKSLPFLTLHKT